MSDITGERATSCMAFVRSAAMQRRYRELMACGDVADTDLDDANKRRRMGARGRSDKATRDRIEKESQEASRMIATGMSKTDVAAHFGIGFMALASRLKARGLWEPSASRKQQAVDRVRIDEEARAVNERAKTLGSLSKALDGASISENQYHGARIRLNLPAIPKPWDK